MTKGQLVLLMIAAAMFWPLFAALWTGRAGYPAVADRGHESKLYWAGVIYYAAGAVVALVVLVQIAL